MANKTLTVMSPEQGLSRYLTEIRKFPMLTKDEEFMLAKRWSEHQDTEAAHRASLEIPAVQERIARAMPIIDREGMTQQELVAVTGIPSAP